MRQIAIVAEFISALFVLMMVLCFPDFQYPPPDGNTVENIQQVLLCWKTHIVPTSIGSIVLTGLLEVMKG